MEEVYKFAIGITILFLGIPIGNFLAKITREELKFGKRWFKILALACAIAILPSLFLKNYVMFFSLLFMIVVISRSLKIK